MTATTSSADETPDSLRAACLHNASPEVVADHLKRGQFFWLDLEGPTDERLTQLAKNIGLHPLTVDDARTFDQLRSSTNTRATFSSSCTASIRARARAGRSCARCT